MKLVERKEGCPDRTLEVKEHPSVFGVNPSGLTAIAKLFQKKVK